MVTQIKNNKNMSKKNMVVIFTLLNIKANLFVNLIIMYSV